MAFVKLDCGILDSTLWVLDSDIRIVFLTMLAMSDPTGLCRATAPGIARRANLPLEETRNAISILEGPDQDSRSQELEGRRIQRVEGGYQLVNFTLYRTCRDEGERREYMREYMARRRHGDPSYGQKPKENKHHVSSSKPKLTKLAELAQAEAEGEAEGEAEKTDAEDIKNISSLSCTELREKGASSAPNGSGVFLKTCRMGEEWEVPVEKITEWEESYPDVDVKLTLLGIRQWLKDNPAKRKTLRGMVRFVGAWMMREQEKPYPRGTSNAQTTKH